MVVQRSLPLAAAIRQSPLLLPNRCIQRVEGSEWDKRLQVAQSKKFGELLSLLSSCVRLRN
jgi:hypothetical protein